MSHSYTPRPWNCAPRSGWLLATALLLAAVDGRLWGAAAGEDPLPKTDIFVGGQGGYHTYRIPAVVVSPNGTILAFCEGRKANRTDDGDIDLLLRRSTDGGRTWLPVQLLQEEGGDKLIKFGNPCPVVDVETGSVILVTNRSMGETSNGRVGGEILIMESKDNGSTWSKPRDITSQVKRPSWKHYAEGPGIGIQLRRGPHRGRLVVPANYRESYENNDPSFSHVMLSDDHGLTWRLGGIVGPHTNECQVAEIIQDGKPGLLMNMRNHWGRAGRTDLSGRQLVSRSFDGGVTWSPAVVENSFIEPPCQASLFRHTSPTGDVLLFCNPASTRRERLTVRASSDEGRTWSAGRVVEANSAAYSSLTQLADGAVGLVYERDDYARLTFVKFPVSWVTAADSKQ